MPTRSIGRDEKGSILIPAAFMLTILIGLIGGAIDLVRMSLIESKLQSALDNAALSASSLNNDQPVGQVISEYVAANLGDYQDQIDDFNIPTPRVNAGDNSKEVTIRAEGAVPTYFLRVIGIDSLPVGATVIAAQGQTNTEISLVLDISWSMRGQKIANLKSAAVAFVEEVLGDDRDPTTTINLVPYGGTVNLGTLFDRFVVELDDPNVELDPSKSRYQSANVATEKFRFSTGDSCIEYRPDDFTNDDVPPSNERSQLPDFWRFNAANRWCPYSTSSLLLNSNNLATLGSTIRNFTLSDGTGSDVGLVWGYRALSPKWRGLIGGNEPARPAAFDNEDTIKVIVWMTDGATTGQLRPKDPGNIDTKNNRSNRKRVTNKNTNRSQITSVCEQARDNDVIVFTIGFQITPGGFQEQDLQECASSLGHYHLVEDLDIATAFESIASSIGSLRITN